MRASLATLLHIPSWRSTRARISAGVVARASLPAASSVPRTSSAAIAFRNRPMQATDDPPGRCCRGGHAGPGDHLKVLQALLGDGRNLRKIPPSGSAGDGKRAHRAGTHLWNGKGGGRHHEVDVAA